MSRKPDGRRDRGYLTTQPPARGCVVTAVDQHTATIRSADPLASEDLLFVQDVLEELHRQRRADLDPESGTARELPTHARAVPPHTHAAPGAPPITPL